MRNFGRDFLAVLVAFICLLAGPISVYADTGVSDIEELKKEVAVLKERINMLEAQAEANKPAAQAAVEKAAQSTGLTDTVTSFAKEIQVHGFVDSSYVLNTNTPVAPNARTNNLRVFDTEANGFMFNMAELDFEKPVSQASPLGFRLSLDAGQDAKLIHASGLGTATDEFDLKQAYAQFYVPFSLPFMHALKFYVGKYATLHGAEVIQSVDNWNFSRSYLFGYAIPFTHTGIRAYYKPFGDIPVESYIGIVNGWDNVVDNNKAKTVEYQIGIAPYDKLSFTVSGMFGPERYNSDKDIRTVMDFVATYAATDKLTLKINYDYGWERNGATILPNSGSPTTNITAPVSTGLRNKDASWDGIAAYAKYSILDRWSMAGRGEYFHDRDGVRTGVLVNNNVPDLDVWEFTLTNEFKLYQNLLLRLEYRYDKASSRIFTKDKLTANYQNTLAAEVIAKF